MKSNQGWIPMVLLGEEQMMDVNDRIYIPPKGAKKPMRGDRWLALCLFLGALFWLGFYLALR